MDERRDPDEAGASEGTGEDATADDATHEATSNSANDATNDDEPADPAEEKGFDLEPEYEDSDAAPTTGTGIVADLDVCPSCGAALRGRDTVVCLRCGFDLKSLATLATSRDASSDEADKVEPPPVLVREGLGGLLAPAIVAAIAALISVIGYLSGAAGLLPRPAADAAVEVATSGSVRLEALARYPAIVVLWSACGLIGLGAVSWLRGRSFGDLALATVRMLAVVTFARLVAFIALPWPIVEFPAEALGQAAVFLGATMGLFRLGWRDAAMTLGVTICAFFTLYVTSHLLAWAL